MTCLDGLRSLEDIGPVLVECAGPDWAAKALYGLGVLVVILVVSGLAAAVIVGARR